MTWTSCLLLSSFVKNVFQSTGFFVFSSCTSNFSADPLLLLSIFFTESALYMYISTENDIHILWASLISAWNCQGSLLCYEIVHSHLLLIIHSYPEEAHWHRLCRQVDILTPWTCPFFAKQSPAVPMLNGIGVKGYFIRSARSTCNSGFWDLPSNCMAIFPCCLYSTILFCADFILTFFPMSSMLFKFR